MLFKLCIYIDLRDSVGELAWNVPVVAHGTYETEVMINIFLSRFAQVTLV